MKKSSNDPYDFADCLICQTAKAAEAEGRSLSEPELKDAFARQAEKQQREELKPTNRKDHTHSKTPANVITHE